MRNPPPGWVQEAVAAADLSSVPSAWLPVEKAESVLDDELGCGVFGCVLRTSDPNVVVKVTSDPSEARFIQAMLELGDLAPYQGLVRYFGLVPTGYTRRLEVRETPPRDKFGTPPSWYGKLLGYQDLSVSMVWREIALHVGIGAMKRRPPRPEAPVAFPPKGGLAELMYSGPSEEELRSEWAAEKKGWGKYAPQTFEEFVQRKSEWAQKDRERYERELAAWEATRWFTGQEIKNLERLWGVGIKPYYDAVRSLYRLLKDAESEDQVHLWGSIRLAWFDDIPEKISKLEGMSWSPDAQAIGSTLRELWRLGIVLDDLHPGNFGMVQRPEGERWVITDPGKAIFVDQAQVTAAHEARLAGQEEEARAAGRKIAANPKRSRRYVVRISEPLPPYNPKDLAWFDKNELGRAERFAKSYRDRHEGEAAWVVDVKAKLRGKTVEEIVAIFPPEEIEPEGQAGMSFRHLNPADRPYRIFNKKTGEYLGMEAARNATQAVHRAAARLELPRSYLRAMRYVPTETERQQILLFGYDPEEEAAQKAVKRRTGQMGLFWEVNPF